MLFIAILKKNMLLFITLAVSLAASVALLFLVLQKYQKIKEYQRILQENRAKIDEAAKMPPPGPVQENLDNIKKDTLVVQKKADEIHYLFGKPYRAAFQAFCEVLGENEFAMYKRWRELFLKESKMGSQPEQIFASFVKKYEPETLNAAKEAFWKVMDKETLTVEEDQKISVEPYNVNSNDILLEAMGLQRRISPEVCKAYMLRMSSNLMKLLSANVGKGISITVPDRNIFTVYENKLPVPDHIPYIIRNYKMVEDLVYRMKGAGVTNLKSLAKTGTIEGYTERGYHYLPYKMTVSCPLGSLRDLVNSMKNAYKENRVYKIKYVSIEKVKDEAAPIAAAAAEKKQEVVEDENVFKPAKDDAESSGSTAAPAKLILGDPAESEVTSEITFEYVTFIENDMVQKAK